MSKANLLLKNDVGLVLDITESPLGCTIYDLEGNEIGGGGSDLLTCNIKVINHTGMGAGLNYNPGIQDGGIITEASIGPINNNDEADAIAYCYHDSTPYVEVKGIKLSAGQPTPATLTASDAVNCSLDQEDPSYPMVLVTGPNASITITLS